MKKINFQVSETAQNEDFKKAKSLKIVANGKDREIDMFVVVELFRFIFYLWFLVIVIVGMAMTYIFVDEDFKKVIAAVFGSVNICAYFDFPPNTYVLPTLYAIQLLIIFQYSSLSIFRAWIAKLENKISGIPFLIYTGIFIYFTLSAAVFSTIFAVQPDPTQPKTVLIHTLPFTNFIVSLTITQVAVTWFGIKVSWVKMKHSTRFGERCLRFGSFVLVISLIVLSTAKVLHQINSLSGLSNARSTAADNLFVALPSVVTNRTVLPLKSQTENGIWFDVHDPIITPLLQTIDKLWLLAAVIGPMIQSGYLTFKALDTHGIRITVGDNRESNRRTMAFGTVRY